jgi:hypothetical protein
MYALRALSLALLAACLSAAAVAFLLPTPSTRPAAALSLQRVGGFSSSSRGASGSSSRLYMAPPPRPTRQNEPDDYFKTNLDKKDLGERLVDPQVLIALVGILLPFIAVGVLFGGGFLTR